MTCAYCEQLALGNTICLDFKKDPHDRYSLSVIEAGCTCEEDAEQARWDSLTYEQRIAEMSLTPEKFAEEVATMGFTEEHLAALQADNFKPNYLMHYRKYPHDADFGQHGDMDIVGDDFPKTGQFIRTNQPVLYFCGPGGLFPFWRYAPRVTH